MNNSTLFEKTPVALNGQVSNFKNDVPFLGSMNYGRVYPVYKKLVMPGDRLYLDATSVIRGADPIAPVMGDTFMEYHAFFVPLRILWNHFKQFLGENDTSAWTQTQDYLMPKVFLPIGGFSTAPDQNEEDPWPVFTDEDNQTYYLDLKRSSVFGANRLADYLGIHPSLKSFVQNNVDFRDYWDAGTNYDDGLNVNALPFRAYWEIWNYAYRNENYMDPVLFSKDDNTQRLEGNSRLEGSTSVKNPFGPYIQYRGEFNDNATDQDGEGSAFVLPASKLKDVFTTVLPEAQKGPQVDLLSIGGRAPVISTGSLHDGYVDNAPIHTKLIGTPSSGTVQTLAKAPLMGVNTNLTPASNGASANLSSSGYGIAFDNLYADLSNTATLTINAFRLAATTQQWYELAARAGTRFDETIFANFGVFAPSSQIDVPEYLGGVKFAINSWQVPQTAPNADGSGLGTVGAFTHTSDTGSSLVGKAFTEWGYVMVMAVPRVHHEYATYCDPHFFQEGKFDLYWPLFDHIGEQPITEKITNPAHALVSDSYGDPYSNNFSVFKPDSSIGFQEAWWFERYSMGNVAGVLNPVNPNKLDYWTYVEELESPLNVGPLFMSAYDDAAIVDKTLQLGSEASLHGQQLMVSILFRETCARRMSLRSVPGITRI